MDDGVQSTLGKPIYTLHIPEKHGFCGVWVWVDGSKMKTLEPLWMMVSKVLWENQSIPFIFQKNMGFVGFGCGWMGLR